MLAFYRLKINVVCEFRYGHGLNAVACRNLDILYDMMEESTVHPVCRGVRLKESCSKLCAADMQLEIHSIYLRHDYY